MRLKRLTRDRCERLQKRVPNCRANPGERFQTAAEMLADLERVAKFNGVQL